MLSKSNKYNILFRRINCFNSRQWSTWGGKGRISIIWCKKIGQFLLFNATLPPPGQMNFDLEVGIHIIKLDKTQCKCQQSSEKSQQPFITFCSILFSSSPKSFSFIESLSIFSWNKWQPLSSHKKSFYIIHLFIP